MEFRSYEEIMDYLNECALDQRNINKRLVEKGVTFFDIEKQELRKRLKELKVKFKYYNNFIEGATTFDTDLLASFLVDYLSRNTDSRYLVCRAERVESCGRSYSHSYHKFICSATDVLKLQINGFDVDSRLGYDELKSNLDSRYIVLNEANSHSLIGIGGLTYTFEAFPELLEISKKLVDLKITCPMMSDEERLVSVLGNTMSNCRLNWKVKSFNRKIPNGKKIKDMSMSEIFSSKR